MELLEKFWRAVESNVFDKVKMEIEDILLSGYPVLTILKQLSDQVLRNTKLQDTQKARICLRIAEADKKLADGASEHFQLMDISAFVMRTYHSTS